jgi:hypothetical protein
MNPRIIPLNLPAGLEREIPGNPVTTRLESAIGNCYPGLEVDVRNLDRRFFPCLVFEFVPFDKSNPAVATRGAKLVAVEPSDPDLPDDAVLRAARRRLSLTFTTLRSICTPSRPSTESASNSRF